MHATSATDARMAEDWFVQAYSLQDITFDLHSVQLHGCRLKKSVTTMAENTQLVSRFFLPS